jgi:hypothetical protein
MLRHAAVLTAKIQKDAVTFTAQFVTPDVVADHEK